MEHTKKCTQCKFLKPLSQYGKQAARIDGLKAECKECNSKRMKEYYCQNYEKITISVMNWQKRNRKKCNKYTKTYRHTNQGRARELTYKHLKKFLKKENHNYSHTVKMTLGDFKTYIASKFQLGMSWDNYGEWELDHIKPLSSFNLLDPQERKRANHYTNLQPLWKKDNSRKRNS